MKMHTISLSALTAGLILAAAPVLAQDTATAAEALNLQLRTEQREQLRLQLQDPGSASDPLLQRTQTQTRTRSQTHVQVRDSRYSGSTGAAAGGVGGQRHGRNAH